MSGPSTLSPRAAATRDAILEAARACFAERGLAATTTRAIAKRAGVTQPLVHHYFGSKDALFDAVLEASMVDYHQAQTEQWARPMGDVRFFTQGLTVLFAWLGEHRDLMRLSAWARLEGRQWSPAQSTAEVSERVRARLEHFRDAGMLRPDVDIDVVMLMIDAQFKGYWDRRDDYGRQSIPVDLEAVDARFVEQSLRMLILGTFRPDVAVQALSVWEADQAK